MVDYRRDYRALLDACWRAGESRRGEELAPDKGWQKAAEFLVLKLAFHLETAWNVTQGTPVPKSVLPAGTVMSFVDFSSLAVLVRAAFETYLALYHIFVDPAVSEERRHLRRLIWELGGLRDRQEFPATQPESLATLAREKQRIDELKVEIATAPEFQSLDEDEQRRALKGQWRLKSKWEDLAAGADQHKGWFIQVYRHLCGHSHTSYLSGVQLRQATRADQEHHADVLLGIGCKLMSHFLRAYATLSPNVAAALPLTGPGRTALETWHVTASDMDRVYGGP